MKSLTLARCWRRTKPSIDLPFTMNLHAGWAWEIEFMHFIRSFGGKIS